MVECSLFVLRWQTYCVDAQVADSACSATAYLGGAKANLATIGVSARVRRNHCSAARDPQHHVHSIAEWALSDGRDAGDTHYLLDSLARHLYLCESSR